MRVQLSIACLLAAAMAIDLTKTDAMRYRYPSTMLAQANASCFPNIGCGCGCGEESEEQVEAEKDGHMETEVDVVEAAIEGVEDLGDEIVEDGHLEEQLADVVGEHEAEALVKDVIEPIIETEVLNEETNVQEIVDAIEEVLPQEGVDVEDPVPDTTEVVEELEQEVIPDHEEVTVIDTPEDNLGINDEDLENTEIIEITNPAGDTVDVIIVSDPSDVPPAKDETTELEVVDVEEEEPTPAAVEEPTPAAEGGEVEESPLENDLVQTKSMVAKKLSAALY